MKKKLICQYCNFNFAIIFIFALSFQACQPKRIDIEKFYFPIDKLAEGKVYFYNSDNLEMPPSYWYYAKTQHNDTTFLISKNYDVMMNLQQDAKERRVKNGMLLESNNLFLKDSSGQVKDVKVEVLDKNLFPFSVLDSNGIFLYKVKWFSGKDMHTTITRNRRFLGFETLYFKDKNVKCAKFEVKELIEDFKNGYIEYPFNGVEYYAEGIGLLKYEKTITTDVKLSYKLEDILSVPEFEKKYNIKLNVDQK